jgi:hypothetical protein
MVSSPEHNMEQWLREKPKRPNDYGGASRGQPRGFVWSVFVCGFPRGTPGDAKNSLGFLTPTLHGRGGLLGSKIIEENLNHSGNSDRGSEPFAS